MTFDTILISIITSAGGIGAICWVLVKSISKYVVEDLTKKYQLSLDKQLEEYKKTLDLEKAKNDSILSSKTHITKAKFDIEFEIYRKLSQAFMQMATKCSFLFSDDNFYYDRKHSTEFWVKKSINAINAVDEAQNVLYQNAPFISNELYPSYESILYDCQEVVLSLEPLAHGELNGGEETDRITFISSKTELVKKILSDLDKLNILLREYLNSLDII